MSKWKRKEKWKGNKHIFKNCQVSFKNTFMLRFLFSICFVISLSCQYFSFYYFQSLRNHEREKLATKESLKSISKLNEIPIRVTTNISSLLHNNACNSTLIYPNYHHSAQCYSHLYSLLLFLIVDTSNHCMSTKYFPAHSHQ